LDLMKGELQALGGPNSFARSLGDIVASGNRKLLEVAAAAARNEPVYNALFFPVSGAENNVLLDRVETSIQFYIGERAEQSALRGLPISTSLRQKAKSQESLALTVVMTCWICEEQTPQSKIINYSEAERRSGVAIFQITPAYDRADNGSGTITFSLISRGIEVDHLKVPMVVARPGVPIATNPDRPTKRAMPALITDAGPDIALSIAQVHGKLSASLEAYDPELRALLGGQNLGPDGSPRWFALGTMDRTSIHEIMRRSYPRLRLLVEQGPARPALRDVAAISAAAQDVGLTENETRAAIDTLFVLGSTLYDQLFYQGDPVLRELMDRIERFEKPNGQQKSTCRGSFCTQEQTHQTRGQIRNDFGVCDTLSGRFRFNGSVLSAESPVLCLGRKPIKFCSENTDHRTHKTTSPPGQVALRTPFQ
jgi:hypothetical protein